MTTKRKIGVAEIEAQAALELPDRELMVTVAIFNLANGDMTPLPVPPLSQSFFLPFSVGAIEGFPGFDPFLTAFFGGRGGRPGVPPPLGRGRRVEDVRAGSPGGAGRAPGRPMSR